MEQLLDMAAKVCDDVELYSLTETTDMVNFKRTGISDLTGQSLSGVCLRIIKDGRLGFAYTRNLLDREELLRNALSSLTGGVPALFRFPHTTDLRQLKTYDSSFDDLSSADMVDECRRVCDRLKAGSDSDLTVIAYAQTRNIRVLNSAGSDMAFKTGEHWMVAMLSLPGSTLGILRHQRKRKFTPLADDIIEDMLLLDGAASRVARFRPGKMKTLVMPASMVTFTWRLASGANAKNVHEGISPLADRIGEQIFDNRITVIDDPLNDAYAGARPFDDEGVAGQPLTIVENGVLRNFFSDLNYGYKLGRQSTGHGYKTEPLFKFSDPLTLKPIPAPTCLMIQPGGASFADLVQAIDRGIIINNIQGAHSGNIPNGDFSVGVPCGFYVENGQIIGRVKDTMIAGNIYDVLNRVVDIGDTLHPCWDAWVPSMLFYGVKVSTKE